MKEIKQIISTYDRLKTSGLKLALARVIDIKESSYRRIGARMLVSENGVWVGGISGGCLEGDALQKAQNAIYRNKASIVTYDTTDSDDNQIGIGLGCEGVIDVLYTPIDISDNNNEIEQLREIVLRDEPAILLRVLDSESLDQNSNSKVIYNDESDISFAHISDQLLNDYLDEIRAKRSSQVFNINTAENRVQKILLEYLKPEIKLIVIGDNYDAAALCTIADEMGWMITIVGRKRKITKPMMAVASAICEYEDLASVALDEYTAVVLMTHDYARDLDLIPTIVSKGAFYFGILGPAKRREKLIRDLDDKFSNEISDVYSPVGLDIGAETPEEIAISIIAEILAVSRSRHGHSLKDRITPIHERPV